MLNPIYFFDRLRDVLQEFEPSRERSLAATKLDECELWLTRCKPTKEAAERDQMAPPPACPEPYCDGDAGHDGKHYQWVPE